MILPVENTLLDNPAADDIRFLLPFLNLNDGPWVAGGAARLVYEKQELGKSDIDVWFSSQESFESTAEFIHELSNHKGNDSLWNKSFKLKRKHREITIQLQKKFFYTNIDEVFACFDFTCCLFATDGKSIITNEQAIKDTNSRLLIFNKKPLTTQRLRLGKYTAKGFTPGEGVILRSLGLDEDQTYIQEFEKEDYP